MNDPTCDFSEAQFETTGTDVWPSCFAVTDLAVASMGAAGAAAADLIEALNLGARPQVSIDRRLASLWFSRSIAPKGWELPPIWDAIAGDYEGADGWIRLHTNAPHHRAAALSVLNCAPDRETVSDAVRGWNVVALEQTVVSASGAAAVMRDRAAWLSHPQGSAVAGEPLVQWDTRDGSTDIWRPTRARPLAGLRVLDLTRVLAGPVATRVLAGFGADVLRVDPPGWEEPNVVPDVTLGKRCCRLDLKDESDLA
ncbi:MAG: CoA transferase, partial [Pseudomonadota bacterium]